ncbi:MAG: hypothetical protein K8L99_12675 [Anaerolineae bacterium]|nr:hypothetical protein [Anaerolineae bacterium]
MLRLWWHLLTRITPLALVPLLIIHLQPVGDADLRTFFLPPAGCPAPCWLGVRPGWTSVDEAVRLLENHEWITAVHKSASFYDFEWSGRQPAWIDTDFDGHFRASGSVVEAIRIRTTLSNGMIFALLGSPETGIIYTPLNTSGLGHTVRFEINGAEISGLTRCPMRSDSFWYTPVEVQYRLLRTTYFAFDYTMADWMDLQPCR